MRHFAPQDQKARARCDETRVRVGNLVFGVGQRDLCQGNVIRFAASLTLQILG
jgi:hypothetical protein